MSPFSRPGPWGSEVLRHAWGHRTLDPTAPGSHPPPQALFPHDPPRKQSPSACDAAHAAPSPAPNAFLLKKISSPTALIHQPTNLVNSQRGQGPFIWKLCVCSADVIGFSFWMKEKSLRLPCGPVAVLVQLLSRVWLFVTPWTTDCYGLLSMGFPRQEYWSGLPLPSPGDLPDPGIKPTSPELAGGFLTTEPPGKPIRGPWAKGKIEATCKGQLGLWDSWAEKDVAQTWVLVEEMERDEGLEGLFTGQADGTWGWVGCTGWGKSGVSGMTEWGPSLGRH